MEIDQLKYFLAVAKYKHFTMAAEEICISQSYLSKQIKALEQELGVKLFDRNTRNIYLTAFGEEFVLFSKKVIHEYDEMNLKLRVHIGLEKHKIIIGAVPVMNQYGIASLIAFYQKKFPLIHIELLQKKTKELIGLLDKGEIDVAFYLTDAKTETGFDTYPVIHDEIVLVTDVKHPLAARRSISFSELSEENFIFFDAGSGMHEISIASCLQAGFTPKIIHNCTQVDTMLDLVSEGLGVALLMERSVRYFHNPRAKIVHFEKPIIASMVLAIPANRKIPKDIIDFRDFSLEWLKKN